MISGSEVFYKIIVLPTVGPAKRIIWHGSGTKDAGKSVADLCPLNLTVFFQQSVNK